MVNIIYCEFLKLKRSRIMVISILGSLAPVLFGVLGGFGVMNGSLPAYVACKDVFGICNNLVTLLFGAMIYGIIAIFLFSREYSEHTLKTLLCVPVSRAALFVGKYLMFVFWMLLLTVLCWLLTLVACFIGGASGFGDNVLPHTLLASAQSCLLFCVIMSPFILLAILLKNPVTAIIILAVAQMATLLSLNSRFFIYNPLALPDVISRSSFYHKPPEYVSVIIAVIVITFIASLLPSLLYFCNSDVK